MIDIKTLKRINLPGFCLDSPTLLAFWPANRSFGIQVCEWKIHYFHDTSYRDGVKSLLLLLILLSLEKKMSAYETEKQILYATSLGDNRLITVERDISSRSNVICIYEIKASYHYLKLMSLIL